MKKTLLLTLEFPPDRGGVARYYGGLVDAMPRESVIVYRAQLSHFLWPRWLPLIWHVWRVVHREQITEVWAGHLLPLGTVVYFLRKIIRQRLPITVFIHGYDLLLAEKQSRKWWLAKRILRNADRIIANSNAVKAMLITRGVSREKVRVIYPCTTISPKQKTQSQKLRERYGLQNKKILLTVARLVKRKGVDVVLQALQKIHDPDITYVIIGDGPERENLEVQSRKVIRSKVIFTGAIKDDELAAWYDACDVFIMTPKKIGPDVEGFGIVYLEANAFGKPVIGSRTGGVPEAVIDGETGLLVDEGDVDATADAIKRLCSDGALRKKLGEQGRVRVEREFQKMHFDD